MSGSDNSLEFRRLCDDELDAAYMIISDAVDWLPVPKKFFGATVELAHWRGG